MVHDKVSLKSKNRIGNIFIYLTFTLFRREQTLLIIFYIILLFIFKKQEKQKSFNI